MQKIDQIRVGISFSEANNDLQPFCFIVTVLIAHLHCTEDASTRGRAIYATNARLSRIRLEICIILNWLVYIRYFYAVMSTTFSRGFREFSECIQTWTIIAVDAPEYHDPCISPGPEFIFSTIYGSTASRSTSQTTRNRRWTDLNVSYVFSICFRA
jgi:hypothetical protein